MAIKNDLHKFTDDELKEELIRRAAERATTYNQLLRAQQQLTLQHADVLLLFMKHVDPESTDLNHRGCDVSGEFCDRCHLLKMLDDPIAAEILSPPYFVAEVSLQRVELRTDNPEELDCWVQEAG